MWKLKIIIALAVLYESLILIDSLDLKDEPIFINYTNISWLVGIYKVVTRNSLSTHIFLCQGILVKPTMVYTTDQCLKPMTSHSDFKVCTYNWNNIDKQNRIYQQRNVIGIGHKNIHLSSSVHSIPVRRLAFVFLSSSFDLHSDLPYYPIQQSLTPKIMNQVDMNNCHYIGLIEDRNNGISMLQKSAKYVSDRKVCCIDDNTNELSSTDKEYTSNNVCVRCDVGMDTFCAPFNGKTMHKTLQKKDTLGSSLACQAKKGHSIFVMGILIDFSSCAPRYNKL